MSIYCYKCSIFHDCSVCPNCHGVKHINPAPHAAAPLNPSPSQIVWIGIPCSIESHDMNRDAFENYVKTWKRFENGRLEKDEQGLYWDSEVNSHWQGWKAAILHLTTQGKQLQLSINGSGT